jgi:CheY-like chemotaxis protein
MKVSFANEIGKICHANDVDSHEVMNIFVQDTKLNISSYYLKPGFAFGGSCLPKDVRGINHLAEKAGVETPLLKNIMASNESQIGYALSLVEKCSDGPIGFLGVTFKADTDDLRESPVLPLIAGLIDKGREVCLFDPNLNLEASVRHHLQHSKHADDNVGRLMQKLPELVRDNIADVFEDSSTIVVSHKSMLFREAIVSRRDDQHVVDLIRLFDGNSIIDQIFEVGMNDYLQKPTRAPQLLEKVSFWTGELASARVLIVDDDASIRMVTKAILEKAGHKASEAVNGAEAMVAMKANNYDIIFMDVSMPVMDGLDATKAARQLAGRKRSTPIIALSAHADPEESVTYEGICW